MSRDPTKQDLRHWRKLVAAARACAVTPGAFVGDLEQAIKRARRSVVPGVCDRTNPFVRLVREAQRFVAATAGQRADLAANLRGQVDECAGGLGQNEHPPPTAPPPVRARADIDG